MPRVIIITGTPGVGKSTVARRLANRLNYDFIDVSRLVKEEKLYSRFDSRRKTFVANSSRLKTRFHRILDDRGSEGLVVSTHYLDGYIRPGVVARVFVLRLNPDRLIVRLQRRRWGPEKIGENVEAELVGVCLAEAIERYGKKKVHEIDTTDKSSVRLVREMMRSVGTGGKRARGSVGVVDWLGSFEPERGGTRKWRRTE